MKLLLFLLPFVIFPVDVFSKTHGEDVYDKCPKEQTSKLGSSCDIPFVTCNDGKRCFNNSKCVLSKKKDPITKNNNKYPNGEYLCDCSYAKTKESQFAGLECEHSDTAICETVKDGLGSKFCTNGGQCLDMIQYGQVHGGCACPDDFVGAHCQYLRVDVTGGGLVGEALFSDVQENFWAFVPHQTTKKKATAVAIVVSICAIGMIAIAFGFAVVKRKRISAEKNENRLPPIDTSSMEADGSGSMKANEML